MTEERYDITGLYIEMGADPVLRRGDGVVPLHIPAYSEYVEILLGAGANAM